MKKKTMIAPSILSADFSRLGEEVEAAAKAGADWVHIDVMDGVFVPNLTIGPCVVRSIRGRTKIPFDVHLMIEDPVKYVKEFSAAGADIITFHIEACKDPGATIAAIRGEKKLVGISVKPGTDVSAIEGLLQHVDLALVMTVEPGFGGQSFMDDCVAKIKKLSGIFKGHIQVDGGINVETAKKAVAAGAGVLVAGTAVFGEKNYKEAIRRLRGE